VSLREDVKLPVCVLLGVDFPGRGRAVRPPKRVRSERCAFVGGLTVCLRVPRVFEKNHEEWPKLRSEGANDPGGCTL
jgi:hypothetical protein